MSETVHRLSWSEGSDLETFEIVPGSTLIFNKNSDNCDIRLSGVMLSSSYKIPSTIPFKNLKFTSSTCSDLELTVNITSTNYTLSESYYLESLLLWPQNCGALGYLTELYASQNDFVKGGNMMDILCDRCGKDNEAGSLARELFEEEGVVLPEGCVKNWDVDWTFPDNGKYLTGFDGVEVNEIISFTWTGNHDVYLMESMEKAEECDFEGAVEVGEGRYRVKEEDGGGRLAFACKVGEHCEYGQRIAMGVAEYSGDLFWDEVEEEVEEEAGEDVEDVDETPEGTAEPRYNMLDSGASRDAGIGVWLVVALAALTMQYV
ncbi:hypothetical protein TL16_g05993 [Triparma laevis f. inornata]|uniref:Uncharacterized protein n=2 Tax=Triparma laevis TaxID=1534972 RepID=A0A9W7CBE8_9STRA|nr:hypothetical protein TL16_g05993 [Triparma laevis f. inornata]GMI03442.1 hypothetical protein TrLO_g6330 [Triparma laevis f. longispina]